MSNQYKTILGILFTFLFSLLIVQTIQIKGLNDRQEALKERLLMHEDILGAIKDGLKAQVLINDALSRR